MKRFDVLLRIVLAPSRIGTADHQRKRASNFYGFSFSSLRCCATHWSGVLSGRSPWFPIAQVEIPILARNHFLRLGDRERITVLVKRSKRLGSAVSLAAAELVSPSQGVVRVQPIAIAIDRWIGVGGRRRSVTGDHASTDERFFRERGNFARGGGGGRFGLSSRTIALRRGAGVIAVVANASFHCRRGGRLRIPLL